MPHVDPSFTEIAQRLGPLVDAALDGRTQPAPGWPEQLRAAMRHSLLAPGKRIRPLLVLLATEACGGKIEAALPAACAVEMVHAYSLIHDDLPALDNDDLRRGRPTCHKAFDEATAILAGDGLLTLAFEVLANEVRPPHTAALCCAALAKAAGPCNMVGGQADDIGGEGRGAGGGGQKEAEGGREKGEEGVESAVNQKSEIRNPPPPWPCWNPSTNAKPGP
jgi:geranylgeranyl diphosphate synthase type II